MSARQDTLEVQRDLERVGLSVSLQAIAELKKRIADSRGVVIYAFRLTRIVNNIINTNISKSP